MRVMVLVKATDDSEASTMPSAELLEAMEKFNEDLTNAGILLDGQGLKPSAEGKRVAFDGPFAKTGELVAGFWLWGGQGHGRSGRVGETLPQSYARPQ